MASVDEMVWVEFEIDLDLFEEVHNAGPNQDWNAYNAPMRNIRFVKSGEEVAEDGDHEVPFWAMLACYEKIDSMAKQTGWMSLEYRRLKVGGKNTAEFR